MKSNIGQALATAGSRGVLVWCGIWAAGLGACGGEKLSVGNEPGADQGTSGGSGGSGGSAGSGSAGTGNAGSGSSGGSGGAMCMEGGASGSGGTATSTPEPGCPCTRRGSQVSRSCERGSGRFIEYTIGPDGGIVSMNCTAATAGNVPFEIDIAPGTFTEPVTIRITELRDDPPEGYVDWSPVYLVEPVDLELQGAELQIGFSNTGNTIPQSLSIFQSSSLDEAFEVVPENYVNAGFNQGTLLRGGYLFVGDTETPLPEGCD